MQCNAAPRSTARAHPPPSALDPGPCFVRALPSAVDLRTAHTCCYALVSGVISGVLASGRSGVLHVLSVSALCMFVANSRLNVRDGRIDGIGGSV